MGLLFPGRLLLLPCLSSLPFYNGFYYSNHTQGPNPGYGEGANVTLPCRYHYEPALVSRRPVRIKWRKLSENRALEQDVLVAMGLRYHSFHDSRVHVRLWQIEEHQASLEIGDLQLEGDKRYRFEVIDRLEDESGLVELELRAPPGALPAQLPRGPAGLRGPGRRGGLLGAAVPGLGGGSGLGQRALAAGHPCSTPSSSRLPGAPVADWAWLPACAATGGATAAGGGLHCYDGFRFASCPQGYTTWSIQRLTFLEAQEACWEDDARIAKVGQLFAAWKFCGLDRCDAGWLAHGSVCYPVVHPRPHCGPLEPGIHSLGFPDLQSCKYGVYCHQAR